MGVRGLSSIGLANISSSVNESEHTEVRVNETTTDCVGLPANCREITLEFILWDSAQLW